MNLDPHTTLSQTIAQLLEAAERALQSASAEEYESLRQRIDTLSAAARETFQDQERDRYQALATKLERAEPLTADERDALELLIVGDAEAYLQAENNLEDWYTELRRLLGELDAMRSLPLDRPRNLMHVRALCADARGVVPDIEHYLREKERIERLRPLLRGGIAPEEGRRLAGIIRGMLASEHR